MASYSKSHHLNIPGPLYTDTSCIDCGTCYHLAPDLFFEHTDESSIVIKQPKSDNDWQRAKRALISCPTNSIGVKDAPDDFFLMDPGLPLPVAENVFYLGYTSRDSFGASPYLIRRNEGNILIDSPRFHPWIIEELENLGGISLMILTHQDDVADHQKFHDHFRCDRMIHADEVTDDTKNCEIIIPEGQNDYELFPDIKILMTPGHTKGHINILFDEKYLFTGDHLFVEKRNSKLRAAKGVCWYSWQEQTQSIKKLLKENFEWVLPGHGGWGHFTKEKIRSELNDLVLQMGNFNERI